MAGLWRLHRQPSDSSHLCTLRGINWLWKHFKYSVNFPTNIWWMYHIMYDYDVINACVYIYNLMSTTIIMYKLKNKYQISKIKFAMMLWLQWRLMMKVQTNMKCNWLQGTQLDGVDRWGWWQSWTHAEINAHSHHGWFMHVSYAISQTNIRTFQEGGERRRRRERVSFLCWLLHLYMPHPSYITGRSVKEDISEGLSGPSPLEMPHSSPFKPKSLGFWVIIHTLVYMFTYLSTYIYALNAYVHMQSLFWKSYLPYQFIYCQNINSSKKIDRLSTAYCHAHTR